MSQGQRVIMSSGLANFFRQEVSLAQEHLGVELHQFTEHYLVNLLCDFSHREKAPAVGEEPLALIYKRALEASPQERVQLLKNLGDISLYVSGFFIEFIEKSLVDLDYYISMGNTAYSNLSELVGTQKQGEVLSEIYNRLAETFTELVDILNQISQGTKNVQGDTELLRLYDRWMRTRSQRVYKILREKGMMPTATPMDYIQ